MQINKDLGPLVDLYRHRKLLFVYLGALLMAISLFLRVGLTGYKDRMGDMLPASNEFVTI